VTLKQIDKNDVGSFRKTRERENQPEDWPGTNKMIIILAKSYPNVKKNDGN